MTKVTLYTRVGCHLCDDVKDVIEAVRATRPFDFDVVDIDGDASLRALYNVEVPVIAVNGRKAFKYRLTAEELTERLERAAREENAP